MNSHQRRKARRCYERMLGLKRVPYHMLEMVAEVPGGLEQAQELCDAASIPARLRDFKIGLDGIEQPVPLESFAASMRRYVENQDRIDMMALDYYFWRRQREEAA